MNFKDVTVNVSEPKMLSSKCPKCKDSVTMFTVENSQLIICVDLHCDFRLTVFKGGSSE